MSRIITACVLFLTIYICATLAEKKQKLETSSFEYVSIDTSMLKHKKQVYVPVNLQGVAKKNKPVAKAVLKVRNTSFLDSIYLSRVDYYDTNGRLLKNFIDSILLIKPMTTADFTVKSDAFKEVGDNFIVQWHASELVQKPIIQVVGYDAAASVITTEHGVLLE